MGAAKKIVPLERKAKKTELVEVTSPKKSQSKKGKKARVQPVQELPINTPPSRQTEVEISHEPVQAIAPEPSVAPKTADLVAETSPVNEVDFSRLAGSLTRTVGMTDQEVEAGLRATAPGDRAEEKTQPLPLQDPAPESGQAEAVAAPQGPRDMSKMALFASLAAVILLAGFYFHLNQNIKTLTQQVHDLSAIKTTVSTLDTKIGTMESKVADLETLPAKTRATLMSSILQEMSQKTSYMSTQLESPEQQDKLMRAKELIQQVQTELNTQN